MLLTHTLAQRIVDSILPIAQQNINIMDNQGMILASGQPDRINTFHKGAQTAIQTAQTVEIFPANLKQYSGTRPGLNMPIIVHQKIIGVVGISGHPDKVRPIAQMVKMITELIIEQEVLQEEAHSQSHLRENFTALLLSENAHANQDKLTATAKLLKYDLSLARLVLVIDIQPLLEYAFDQFGISELAAYRTKDKLLQQLTNCPEIHGTDLVVFLETHLIILKHFSETVAPSAYTSWAEVILSLINPENKIQLFLGVGSLASHYTALAQSYQEALFALTKETSNAISSIHDFDILVSYLLEQIHGTETAPILKIKENLNGLTKKYDIKRTILCLLEHNLNLTDTAKNLYIHRNTLLFRLKKFKEITELDPCRFFHHAVLCKIILKD